MYDARLLRDVFERLFAGKGFHPGAVGLYKGTHPAGIVLGKLTQPPADGLLDELVVFVSSNASAFECKISILKMES